MIKTATIGAVPPKTDKDVLYANESALQRICVGNASTMNAEAGPTWPMRSDRSPKNGPNTITRRIATMLMSNAVEAGICSVCRNHVVT